jgi:hypothetical protein
MKSLIASFGNFLLAFFTEQIKHESLLVPATTRATLPQPEPAHAYAIQTGNDDDNDDDDYSMDDEDSSCVVPSRHLSRFISFSSSSANTIAGARHVKRIWHIH